MISSLINLIRKYSVVTGLVQMVAAVGLTVLIATFLLAQVRPPADAVDLFVLSTGYLEKQEATAINSAAACSNVPYGNPAVIPARTASDEIGHFVIPPHQEGATLVDVGLFVEAITDIDPVTNQFTMEGFIDLIWCDPREQFEPEAIGWPEKIYLEDEAKQTLTKIWWPDITFPNSDGARTIENRELIILPNGTIDYVEKFKVTLESNFNLRQFPFDEQVLEIELESLAWTEAHLLFHEEEGKIGFSDRFKLAEWRILSLESEIKPVQEVRESAPFSEFLVSVRVARESGYYVYKIMMPLIILVTLSWATFWIPQANIFQRVRLALSGILIVVAFQFAVTRDLPRLPFLTFIDILFILSFIALATTVIQTLFLYQLWQAGLEVKAKRIEWLSRRLFPMGYLICVVAMLWWTLL